MSNINKQYRDSLTPYTKEGYTPKYPCEHLKKYDSADMFGWLTDVYEVSSDIRTSIIDVWLKVKREPGKYWFRLWEIGLTNFLLEMGHGEDEIVAEWILFDNGDEKFAYQLSGPGFNLPKFTHGRGVYPNSGWSKTNHIAAEDLGNHIIYNLIMRPGRSLLLNEKIVYKGIGYNQEECEKFAAEYKKKPVEMWRATTPYQ